MNRIFAVFALILAACAPPAFAQDAPINPFTDSSCAGLAGGRAAVDSVVARATWTREVGFLGAEPGTWNDRKKFEVDVSLKAGLGSATCFTWSAELVLPFRAAFHADDTSTAGKHVNLSSTATAHFVVQYRPLTIRITGVNDDPTIGKHETQTERGWIVVRVFDAEGVNIGGEDADGAGRYFLPVDITVRHTPHGR